MTTAGFDRTLGRVEAGEQLAPDEIRALASSPDVLGLGMLADALRRRLHGRRATYLREAACPLDAPPDAAPSAARQITVTGSAASLDAAVRGLDAIRALAGGRPIEAFSWVDVERWAAAAPDGVSGVLRTLKTAGLDALASLPLDLMTDASGAVEQLLTSGFAQLRLTLEHAQPGGHQDLWARASALQARFGGVQALSPLPRSIGALRPTTGYQDVKMVALARVAAPTIPSVQVDWARYGPKLAQVALTFGADDVSGVSASDASPEGRRRSAVEEIRRNIEAAGFEAVERDGRFVLVP